MALGGWGVRRAWDESETGEVRIEGDSFEMLTRLSVS